MSRNYPGDWPPRDRDTFGGYPDFDRYGRFRDEPEAPSEPTHEELVRLLGAEPVKNGPTRANHLAYCKQRALEYAPANQPGDAGLAMSSLLQDLGEDERTSDAAEIIPNLMLPLAMTGEFTTPGKLHKWILGFG